VARRGGCVTKLILVKGKEKIAGAWCEKKKKKDNAEVVSPAIKRGSLSVVVCEVGWSTRGGTGDEFLDGKGWSEKPVSKSN